MANDFSLIAVHQQKLAAMETLRDCNRLTAKFGLALNEGQLSTLVEKRFDALKATGRLEMGGGVMEKLIYAFCDSPYIAPANYAQTLAELQDIFYYCKNEADEQVSDDELIAEMKSVFDGKAQGAMDYMMSTVMEQVCRSARCAQDTHDKNKAL